MIGILIGIYLDQEFQALPQLKPFILSTLQKLQQGGADPPPTDSDTTTGVGKEN